MEAVNSEASGYLTTNGAMVNVLIGDVSDSLE